MKSSKIKLGLALGATLISGFIAGFATKSGIDFWTPTITTAYTCVTPLSPVASAVPTISIPTVPFRSCMPVSYGGLLYPFDLPVAPFDAMNRFNQISNVPSIRTEDGDKELKIVAELPDIEQKNVLVDIEPDFVTIKGKQVDQEGSRLIRSKSFVRAMKLPGNVDYRRAQQDFRDGVLTISIPKTGAGSEQCKQKPSLTAASI